MPDIFMPVDTSYNSKLYTNLVRKGVFNKYTVDYAMANRDRLHAQYPEFSQFNEQFQITDAMMDEVREKLRAGMQEQVNRTGAGIYDEMIREYGGGPERTLGQGYKGEYCERCVKRLNEEFGDSAVLVSVLRGFLPETEGARFMLSEAPLPSFSLDYDQSLGEIKGCRVSDIIRRNIDGLDRGDGSVTCGCDPLLKLTDFACKRRLVTDG